MRVVIDTNIWVSGLLWRGAPWRLLRLAEQAEIELCMAPETLDELGTARLTEFGLYLYQSDVCSTF